MNAGFGRRGFTLFEMLAAVAVSMVIAVFVFGFSNSLISIMRASDSKIGTEVDANVALDIIARDLEAAVFREGVAVMFAVDAQSYDQRNDSGNWQPLNGSERLTENDFDPARHRYGWAGSYLRFFTAYPAFNAVSYQIIRRDGFSGSLRRRYTLFRSVVQKKYAEEVGRDIIAAAYETGSGSQDNPNNSGEIRKPELQRYFLDNVVDFGVRLYVYDSSQKTSPDSPVGLRLIYPSDDENYGLSNQERNHWANTSRGSAFDARYPEVVQVYMRVLDRAGAEALIAVEEDSATLGAEYDTPKEVTETEGPFEKIVRMHGRLYSRTVRIPSRAL